MDRRTLFLRIVGVLFFLIAYMVAPAARSENKAGAPTPCTLASFERGRSDLPDVALTFDGGADAGFTERILDILDAEGVSATFFLTGAYIRAYPDLVLRIARTGHEIGNHSWSHPHLTAWNRTGRHDTLPHVSRASLLRELESTARAYRDLSGFPMPSLWRAPYGEVNEELLGWAAAAGWTHVGWTRGRGRTLDSLDWVDDRSSPLYLDSAGIADRILSFGGSPRGLNGGIVLMHLSTRREDPAVARLGGIIATLRSREYRFVTVSALLHDACGSRANAPYRTAALGPE